MNVVDKYFNLLEEVYSYFGFKKDWVIYPLEDRRQYDWKIVSDKEVYYGKKEEILNDTDEYYSDEIYHQRFYHKWVYRGKDYTMIMVSTHTDGNKFFAVFDNSKEIK